MCQKRSGPTQHFTGELWRGLACSGHSEDSALCALLSLAGLGLALDLCGSQPRPRVMLLLLSPPLDPAPLWIIGPPVLLVLTESALHTPVDSTVGGVVEGQSGDGGSEVAVEALREPGAQGADLWVPRLPHEGGALLGALADHCPPKPGPGSRLCLCPFLHTACSEPLCCWLHPELRDSLCPRGRPTHSRAGGAGLDMCVCERARVHACMLARVLKSGVLVKESGWLEFSVSYPT